MREKEIKRRYVGRVEVKAARAEIEAMLAAGQPYVWIYDKLADEGRMTVSYRQFCQCLVQYCGVKVRPKRKKSIGEAAGTASSEIAGNAKKRAIRFRRPQPPYLHSQPRRGNIVSLKNRVKSAIFQRERTLALTPGN